MNIRTGSDAAGAVAFLLALLLVAIDAPACTLWGAAGADASGGTILSKNRDWAPDHTQVLKMRRGAGGYGFFGLYAVGNDAEGIKAGVNEKGLSVVTASAGSIPRATRDHQPGKRGIISETLAAFATCDEILAKKDEIFPHARAMIVMIADGRKVLVAEIGLEGKYVLWTVENGTIARTNHFLDDSLADFNIRIGVTSPARLERITELLKSAPRPLTIDAFAAMSRDRGSGAGRGAIWRTGNTSPTLASWIMETPERGAPRLRVVLANPGQPEEPRAFVLDERFWRETK
jgi:hypothetical protein